MTKASDALKAIVAKGAWYTVCEKGSQGNSATLRFVNETSSYTKAAGMPVGDQ